jgi:cytochrome c oxidase subunit 3
MSNASNPPAATIESSLADSFETSEQKDASGKLGVWVLLCAALLMFGGLFCAYGAYRYNYPRVFAYAHQYMDKRLGGFTTFILIASSFTMAWGVRCAQLGKRAGLIVCLILTLLGGLGSMRVRTIEYRNKRQYHLWVGAANRYHKEFAGDPAADEPKQPAEASVAGDDAEVRRQGPADLDPLAGTPDEPKIKPSFNSAVGLMPAGAALEPAGRHLAYKDLDKAERARISTFFSIYFLMTGLHSLYLLISMGLITWVLLLAIFRKPSAVWAGPAILVGLYFQFVTLIWFFVFPLLYLIH